MERETESSEKPEFKYKSMSREPRLCTVCCYFLVVFSYPF